MLKVWTRRLSAELSLKNQRAQLCCIINQRGRNIVVVNWKLWISRIVSHLNIECFNLRGWALLIYSYILLMIDEYFQHILCYSCIVQYSTYSIVLIVLTVSTWNTFKIFSNPLKILDAHANPEIRGFNVSDMVLFGVVKSFNRQNSDSYCPFWLIFHIR